MRIFKAVRGDDTATILATSRHLVRPGRNNQKACDRMSPLIATDEAGVPRIDGTSLKVLRH
jgi:hypothetical protein